MNRRRTPFQKIQHYFKRQKVIPNDLILQLPRGWKRVGEVGILDLNPKLLPWKHEIGAAYLKFVPELSTVSLKVGTTTNYTRTPNFEVIAGNNETITVHKELGCKFWIDPLKLTFSNGNHAERYRMIKISQINEKVIDMFACVGNLSIPLAVHNPTAKVIGIEINPEAYNFLEKNVIENQIEHQYKPILGDNREITPQNYADRVLMGYFTIDLDQLFIALKSLKQDQGGIIHVHGLSSNRQPMDWQPELSNLIKNSFPWFKIVFNKKRIIKTVAAGIEHFVNDFTIQSIA